MAELHARGVRLVVVTLAERGADVFERGREPLHVPGVSVDVVDVTGAGDTFCSAFLFASLATDDMGLAARFANAAAARAVTVLGGRGGAGGVRAVLEFAREHGLDVTGFGTILGEGACDE